jgi:hypothetical protein
VGNLSHLEASIKGATATDLTAFWETFFRGQRLLDFEITQALYYQAIDGTYRFNLTIDKQGEATMPEFVGTASTGGKSGNA